MSSAGPPPVSFLERISDGYIALDGEWRYLYLNGVALKALGRTAAELIGRTLWEAYPDALDGFGPHFQRAMRERVEIEFEAQYTPLGLWMHLHLMPAPHGLAVLFHDVGARRRAEVHRERLLELNALLSAAATPGEVARAVLDLARPLHGAYGGLIGLVTPDGAHLHVAHHLGYDEAQIAAWRTFPLTMDVPLTHALCTGEALFVSAQEARARFPALPEHHPDCFKVSLPLEADGRTFGVLAFLYEHPLHVDDDLRVFYSTLATHCAQALHRAQLHERATHDEMRYRVLAEATSTAVWTADARMAVTEPQSGWAALTGQDFEETRGAGWLNAVHPHDRAAVRRQAEVGVQGQRPFVLSGRVRRHDGLHREVVANAVPVRGAEGALSGWIGVIQDVTEQRAGERQERERRGVIERLSQATDAPALLHQVTAEVQRLTGADAAVIALWDEALEEYEWIAQEGVGTAAPAAGPALQRVQQALDARPAEGVVLLDRHTPDIQGWDQVLGWPAERVYGFRLPCGQVVPAVLLVAFRADAPPSAADLTLLRRLAGDFGAAVQRARLVRELARRDAHSRRTIEALEEGVVDVHADGRVHVMNDSAARLLNLPDGVREFDLNSDQWVFLDHTGRVLPAPSIAMRRTFQQGERVRGAEIGHLRPDGTLAWWSLNAVPIPDGDGRFARAVVTIQDMTVRRALQQQLERLANEDDLTGLANRRAFRAVLNLTLNTSRAPGEVVAVMLMDLDLFKDINDALGHHAGDGVLMVLADRFRQVVGSEGLVARLGGDEFGVLLHAATPEGARGVAEALLAQVRQPIQSLGSELHLTASVGLTCAPQDASTAADLLRHADLALYQIKSTGRNAVGVFGADLARARDRRHDLTTRLRRALADGALHLAYQPIVRLQDGAPVGAEVLARWTDPDLGVVSPAEFIGLAEESGLILPLGAWVLEAAARQGAAWLREGRAVRLAVNVSPVQFLRFGFAGLVEAALVRTGLPGHLLELEVTESAVMDDVEGARRVLKDLRQLGVRTALDDFGTGHSSLALLHALPFDQLKLDRSFVGGMDEDERQVTLVRGILSLARALQLDVVAEGIETPEQRQVLLDLGCPFGQGYFFARPLAPADLILRHGPPSH